MAVLVGSRAYAYWNPEVKATSDWDLICRDDEVEFWRSRGFDPSPYSNLNNQEMAEKYKTDTGVWLPDGSVVNVMSLEGLAVLKRSHLHRPIKFNRHIALYHHHLAQHMTEEGYEVMKRRQKLTLEKYKQGKPSLKKTNEEFFDDAVEKEFDHDWIHELAAFYDRPLFEKLKHEGEEGLAWCAKDLWEELSDEDKSKCVAEETYVIASERYLIPHKWDFSYRKAYMEALSRVCTTLTSGWFRDWAIDHYPEVVNLFDKGKFDVIRKETV